MWTLVNFHSIKGKGWSNEYMSGHFARRLATIATIATIASYLCAPPHNFAVETMSLCTGNYKCTDLN